MVIVDKDQYANSVLRALSQVPSEIPTVEVDDEKSRNAAACMSVFLNARLASAGPESEPIKQTTYRWNGGIINFRNAVRADIWTNLRPAFAEKFRGLKEEEEEAVYVMTCWQPSGKEMHTWVIPETVAYNALPGHPVGTNADSRTIRILPERNRFEKCQDSPDLKPYYQKLEWSDAEFTKLVEAVKIDVAARKLNRGGSDNEESNSDDDGLSSIDKSPGYIDATVEFVEQLAHHTEDKDWHDENKHAYQDFVRDPTKKLLELLRSHYLERLSPEVAGRKNNVSRLKKNDFGKGGYFPHYWFAFYDPAAGKKINSAQLFFSMSGETRKWSYGFAMGNNCDHYVEQLRQAILSNQEEVCKYLDSVPAGDDLVFITEEGEEAVSLADFSGQINSKSSSLLSGDKLTSLRIVRRFPLESLPDHDESLVEEIGEFFNWVWPFFEASTNGVWPKNRLRGQGELERTESGEDTDEEAPETISQLSAETSLSQVFLEDLEQSLLAKQQTVLVGPPGTSKTFIASQFARYFVRERSGRSQGNFHVLYMHANWTYEDFFEGIKPTTGEDGLLTFQTQQGFFLEWVKSLKDFDSSSRHVLVLDEINRCDTAAVLGELLQLLEYRGTTVRLLSGRQFVFPDNLYVIGTMNSADRSIGRMDLALRRRFFWLSLHPQYDALERWLNRPGNNPVGFMSSTLQECNELLSSRGISLDQHIGHALFMTQQSGAGDEALGPQDIPLTEKHLRLIIKFSVVPYLTELLSAQFGQSDEDLVELVRGKLLFCLNESKREV